MSAVGKETTGIVIARKIAIHEVTELEVTGMAVADETVDLAVQGGVGRIVLGPYKQLISPKQTGEIMTGTTEIVIIRARAGRTATGTAAKTTNDLKDVMTDASPQPETRTTGIRIWGMSVTTDKESGDMTQRGSQKSPRMRELHLQVRLYSSYSTTMHLLIHAIVFRSICRCWPVFFPEATEP